MVWRGFWPLTSVLDHHEPDFLRSPLYRMSGSSRHVISTAIQSNVAIRDNFLFGIVNREAGEVAFRAGPDP